MNVPSLSDITEQIALFLIITVNADKKRTTSFFQAFFCRLRSVVEIHLKGQSWALSAPLKVVLFELLVRKSGFVTTHDNMTGARHAISIDMDASGDENSSVIGSKYLNSQT